jgi:hypothetical protein
MSAFQSQRSIWDGEPAREAVSFPPHLLDELARLFARAAVDRFVQESAARRLRPEGHASIQPESQSDSDRSKDRDIEGRRDDR